jgi:hypothetical protein
MPSVAFHVSSARNRESILRHGLDWTRMVDQPGVAGNSTPDGPYVFLAQDIQEAEWFVVMSHSYHQSVDIWEVRLPDDVALLQDRPPSAPYHDVDGFLCTTEPIPPERLRLVRKDV